MTDAAVIAASVEDPATFAVVFDRHWDRIFRFCVSRAGPGGGEDLAAETFRVAFDGRERFQAHGANARPWLLGIATNLIREFFRAKARRRRAIERLEPGSEPDRFADALERIEADGLGPSLALALASLTAAQRDTFLLHAWEDLTHDEIAAALQIAPATVRTRIYRARIALRAHLQTTPAQDLS